MSAPHNVSLLLPLFPVAVTTRQCRIWRLCRSFGFKVECRAFQLNVAYSGRRAVVIEFSQMSRIIARFTYILLPNANAAQPPIKHSPPSGVIGPSTLNLCGSSTSKYMLPLNIVIPATKSEAAILFLGATDVARRRTPEWISY
jgi:hypothetical protein